MFAQMEEEKEMVVMVTEEEESSSSSTRRREEEEEEDDDGDQLVVRTRDDFVKRMVNDALRVLLVEGDDCTRHIISALLRKCNYKVSAVADGSKAWEILKERPHSVDIVLSEVEVPSISGTSLLSMIMDHESCKNIPVIMMSSHDSINMVFSCMLKGAVDFLVKPIRKNELRNLWQHVWRRHTSSNDDGDTNVHQDDGAKHKQDDLCKANQLAGHVLPGQINKEGSEKGSDAESSCTRSDMEAESTYKQNTMEPQQTTCRVFSLQGDTICKDKEGKIQPNRSLLDHGSKAEDKSSLLETCIETTTSEEVKPMDSMYDNSTPNVMEDQIYDEGRPPKQIIDLIGSIDNWRQCSYDHKENTGDNNNLYDNPEGVLQNEKFNCNSSTMPLLELSLRRYSHNHVEKEEKNECGALNHSNSSAFSMYNSRMLASPFSTTASLQAEGEEHYSPLTKQILDSGNDSSSNVPRWNWTAHDQKSEGVMSSIVDTSNQNGIAIKCSPIRAIAVPIPVGGITFDTSAGYHTLKQPTFYPESSAVPLWSATPSKGKEAIPMNSSDLSDTRDFYLSDQHPLNQSSKIPPLICAPIEHVNTELRREMGNVVSISADSASHVGSNGLGWNCNGNNGNDITKTSISHVTEELRNQVEKIPADLCRLSLREAALNKFRLKRKERCFEKKVRYQSRKRLAEQRPRVKGQFVRHIQPDALSIEAHAYPIEPSVR